LQHSIAEKTQQGEHLAALRLFFSHKEALAPEEMTEPHLLLLVAQNYAGLGLLDEAASLVQMLLGKPGLTPENRAETTLEYAMMLLKNGQTREAKAQVTALNELPNAALDRRRRRVLGEIALHAQQPAEAARHLQRLADLFETVSEQARMQARLAQAYTDQGETEQALQAWQQCAALLAQDDATPVSLAEDCLYHTGRLHFVQQHYPQTLTVFETLLQRFPESSRRDWVHFYMAESYRQLEDEPHMLEHVQMLLDNAHDPLWQQIAKEYVQSTAWRERFHERLAAFHNTLTR
jgi:tetratricopeptide (TPR) repeat protein